MSNDIAVLTYLKSKTRKWKNIAIFTAAAAVFLALSTVTKSTKPELASGIVGDYIANIKIADTIFEDNYRDEVLTKVLEEDSIKAVIVDIDSPGGGIVGSEILFENLRKIAEKKPLVAVMGSIAASGGYMAAIAADHIIAHNGTLTGSIGVLMQSAEITDLASKVGVALHTYKSSPLKASPSPFEKRNSASDQAIEESIKDSADFFFKLVEVRRADKLNKSEISKIFDGRVFTGRQALKAGLIDQIGGRQQALEYLQKNKNIGKNLKIQEISVIKTKEDFFERLMEYVPFSTSGKALGSKHEIMAIFSM